ncbi:hypothetical protein L208DRAFT_1295577 [Tricholoma matsutake]|nr:hypothetical protein L208DRAFT_1295577 [Tricholoma matsutake 945]
MSQNLDLVIAQYSHEKLPGAKHWAIVVVTNQKLLKGIAFQVMGSTSTYEVKQPKEVKLLDSTTYMGNIEVGMVDSSSESTALLTIIQHMPLGRGDLGWNCQHWVIAALEHLKDAQHNISVELSIEQLQAQFSEVQREDM